jgi:hypothetical protein
MTNPTVRYGGQLEIGDFIAIADNGESMILGWYVGRGRGRGRGNETIQYYIYQQPGYTYDAYNEFLNNPHPDNWQVNYYAKHKKFSSKLILKGYIYGQGTSQGSLRVIKITNPETLFTNAKDLEVYNKSKEVLLTLNFPLK